MQKRVTASFHGGKTLNFYSFHKNFLGIMAARWENNAFSRACICYEAGALCCSAANIFISSSLEVLKLLHAIFVLQAKTYLHSLILSFRREWKCHCKEKKHYAFEVIIISVLQFRLQSGILQKVGCSMQIYFLLMKWHLNCYFLLLPFWINDIRTASVMFGMF